MHTYRFDGTIYPERAPLTHQVGFRFHHPTSKRDGTMRISIILNQIAVWVEVESQWDVWDLKNVVKTTVQNEVAVVGYLVGHAYEVEVRRVTCPELGVDLVYGINVPCISDRVPPGTDITPRLARVRRVTVGEHGMLLHRCFNDLVSAMKHADDTGFYCYRAIESLRAHCAARHEIPETKRHQQWEKLREEAQCDEATILVVKRAADPVRHGGVPQVKSDDRAVMFKITWDIVDAYLLNSRCCAATEP